LLQVVDNVSSINLLIEEGPQVLNDLFAMGVARHQLVLTAQVVSLLQHAEIQLDKVLAVVHELVVEVARVASSDKSLNVHVGVSTDLVLHLMIVGFQNLEEGLHRHKANLGGADLGALNHHVKPLRDTVGCLVHDLERQDVEHNLAELSISLQPLLILLRLIKASLVPAILDKLPTDLNIELVEVLYSSPEVGVAFLLAKSHAVVKTHECLQDLLYKPERWQNHLKIFSVVGYLFHTGQQDREDPR